MKKVSGVAKLKKKADKVFSEFIRKRDEKLGCITCGSVRPYKQMHAGHFVKRSVSQLRYDTQNVNGQCPQCNVYKYGEQYAYAQALDKKYGKGTADRLHAQRFTTHKFNDQELLDIINKYA